MIALALTSNLRLADAPGNVMLTAEASGLSRDSVVNVTQIVTVNKTDVVEGDCGVDDAYMELIEEGLFLALGLQRNGV